MKIVAALGLLIGLWIVPASAQSTAENVVTGYLSTTGCSPGQTVCFKAYGGSGGSGMPPYIATPLGQQTISSATLASAQSLTVPTGATSADFYPEGTGGTNNNCVRFRDDGTAPTATVGSPLQPGQLLLGYTGKPSAGTSLSGIQFILATGATCNLTINYYK
jgi:hypothetical protein